MKRYIVLYNLVCKVIDIKFSPLLTLQLPDLEYRPTSVQVAECSMHQAEPVPDGAAKTFRWFSDTLNRSVYYNGIIRGQTFIGQHI